MLHIAIRSLATRGRVTCLDLAISGRPFSLPTSQGFSVGTRRLSDTANARNAKSSEPPKTEGCLGSSKKRQRQKTQKEKNIDVQATPKSSKALNATIPRESNAESKVPQPPKSVPPHQLVHLNHSALYAFFNRYRKDGFVYRSGALPTAEFWRLCDHLHPGFTLRHRNLHPERRKARWKEKKDDLRRLFTHALDEDFGSSFGKAMDDKAAWRKLCIRIGIEPIPDTAKAARKALDRRNCNVSIVEVMTKSIPDGKMRRFKTEEELASYMRRHKDLIYPRSLVERGDILEWLLRHIAE